MSKFQNVLAEAGYTIANHGFALEEHGSVEDGKGWNALADVSTVVLLNVGEGGVAKEFDREYGERSFLVWIREDSNGFVDVVEVGTDEGLRSGTDLVNEAWDKFVAEQTAEED